VDIGFFVNVRSVTESEVQEHWAMWKADSLGFRFRVFGEKIHHEVFQAIAGFLKKIAKG
jgi:hypothetical protein